LGGGASAILRGFFDGGIRYDAFAGTWAYFKPENPIMTAQRKIMASVLLLALAGAATWLWAGMARGGEEKGNIEQALKTDMAAFDEQQTLDFVSGLKLNGSTTRQRIDLFTRLKARFDQMPLTMKLSLLLAMRKVSLEHPDSALMTNGRVLMQAYWNQEVALYIQATPEERKKMIDARIDESLIYENLQKLQDAAKGLFGGSSGPSQEDLQQMQHEVLNAVVDAMKNGTPEDRAAATEYFMAMRQRRQERGLPVAF
jgi:hypothetical protein